MKGYRRLGISFLFPNFRVSLRSCGSRSFGIPCGHEVKVDSLVR